MTTAAALIIGDEILGAKFEDQNGPWLIRWLHAQGVDLRCMCYLPDDEACIAEHVDRLAVSHDWLFTSGGVGPTHDDVTFAAVARGLKRDLERHPELVEVLKRRLDARFMPGAMHMTHVPTGAELWWDGEIEYPVVVVANVVVLPGLPSLFRSKLEAVAHRFEGRLPAQTRLRSTLHESEFSIQLTALAARYPQVSIGSYPRTDPSHPWRVQLFLESHEPEALTRCADDLRTLLGDSLV